MPVFKGNGTDYRSSFNAVVTEYARKLLREELSKCLPHQVDLFNRMYTSIDAIPFDRMARAYDQVMSALAMNDKGNHDKHNSKVR